MSTKVSPIFLLMIIALLDTRVTAQELLQLPFGKGCNYDGSSNEVEQVYSFPPSTKANEVVDEIMHLLFLPSNFTTKVANVPNAMAQVIKGKRYILYDEAFMEQIYNQTGDYWAQVTILAHEIGHHLSGHTLDQEGSRPELELEADKFSGAVLFKMGATLEQAQAAVSSLPENRSVSRTHPPKSARLTAIAVGFREAREQAGGRGNNRIGDPESGVEDSEIADAPESLENQINLAEKAYLTVQLNRKTWMAENLNYAVEDSWCYEDNPANCNKYGRLYTWEAAQKACEDLGMRLPSQEDWAALQAFFDGGYYTYQLPTRNGENAQVTLLSGRRDPDGTFRSLGRAGYFWGSTKEGEISAWTFGFVNNQLLFLPVHNPGPDLGYLSCRCLK